VCTLLAALATLDQRLDLVPVVTRAGRAERPRDDILVGVFAHEAGLELARRKPYQFAGSHVDSLALSTYLKGGGSREHVEHLLLVAVRVESARECISGASSK